MGAGCVSPESNPCSPQDSRVKECRGKPCGVMCIASYRVPPGTEFSHMCDGKGKCVNAELNPCSQNGCRAYEGYSAKKCGDECDSGDVIGRCDKQLNCATGSLGYTPKATLCGAMCKVKNNVQCFGDDIGNAVGRRNAPQVDSAAHCCVLCKNTPGCKAWSWNGGKNSNKRCYVKHSCSTKRSSHGVFSGWS